MNQERIWQEFTALPPEAQRQVMDFIAFLRIHYAEMPREKADAQSELTKEPFVGLWRDRKDMQDSTAWVRNVREREWVKSK